MQLESTFEKKAREALLDDAESTLVGGQNNLIHQTVQEAHDFLRRWGNEADYDVEPVIDSFGGVEFKRSANGLTIRWGWEHEAAVYFEFGTSEHTVEGNPVLSFVWSAADVPRWVKKEFEQEGDGYRVFLPEVEVAGIKETRFGRHALTWLRREISA